MCLYHLLKLHALYFLEVFTLCETENLNSAVYFMTDRHSYEQVHLKVEPKSFLYEFLNSGDPLYSIPISGYGLSESTWIQFFKELDGP